MLGPPTKIMGDIEIVEKLHKKFQTPPTSEEDVVYVLSRIRKLLESKNYPAEFSVLIFYCNLALHVRIDKYSKDVENMLERISIGSDVSDSIINFYDFHRQIKEFAQRYNLPEWIYKINDFNKLLNEIYSDTPIIIKKISEYKITVSKNGIISRE